MRKLDKIDYKVLDILQKNSQITNQELAHQMALSPSSCLQRVRRLEKDGFINGYHAHVDLNVICRFVTCILNVNLKNHSHEELLAFKAMAELIPEVVEYYTVSGECDFILKVIARDMSAYHRINDRLISCSEYSATINTYVVMNENKSFTHIDLDTLV